MKTIPELDSVPRQDEGKAATVSKLPSSAHFQRLLIGTLVNCPGRPELIVQCCELGIGDQHFQASELILWREIHLADRKLRPFDFNALSDHLRITRNGEGDALAGVLADCAAANGIPEAIPQYCKNLIEIKARRDTLLATEGVAAAIHEGRDDWRVELQKVHSIEVTKPHATPRSLIDFGDKSPDPERTLLGRRFLCIEGSLLFVGPSGIGKTSASVQQDLLWSIGEPAFGIVPARPLKIITIQAEDDEGDLSEIVCGVKSGLQFTLKQCEISRKHCLYVTEKSHTGTEFLSQIVRPLLKQHQPDILRINPFQAYLGGDIKDTALTSSFLRNGINPLLEEFQCGFVLVHHTPKTNFRDTTEWKASDWMYAGAGAADITNWCRAALIIDPTTNPRVFRFIAAKRSSRIGWQNDLTGESEYVRHFAHDECGSIFWRDADADEVKTLEGGQKVKKQPEDLLALVPQDKPIEKKLLLAKAQKAEIGVNTARAYITLLIADGDLFEWKVKRSGTNPEPLIARYEQPAA